MELPTLRPTGRVISWFSCGAASAVATKLAIEKYGDAVEIYYTDTGAEHPDNDRFIVECEQWFGRSVTVLRSEKYKDIWEVFEARKFLVSDKGAPCTGAMKKEPCNGIWQMGDIEIFGYTVEENKRLLLWKADNPERTIECPLMAEGLKKDDCFTRLNEAGIALPIMYQLGFRNNNCIGCVKARDNINYWKRVRKHFPEIYERMSALERKFGYALNRIQRKGVRIKVYLDEIEPGDPKGKDTMKISCGLICMAETTAEDDYDWI